MDNITSESSGMVQSFLTSGISSLRFETTRGCSRLAYSDSTKCFQKLIFPNEEPISRSPIMSNIAHTCLTPCDVLRDSSFSVETYSHIHQSFCSSSECPLSSIGQSPIFDSSISGHIPTVTVASCDSVRCADLLQRSRTIGKNQLCNYDSSPSNFLRDLTSASLECNGNISYVDKNINKVNPISAGSKKNNEYIINPTLNDIQQGTFNQDDSMNASTSSSVDVGHMTHEESILISQAISHVGNIFESTFESILTNNFKNVSYGVISTEFVDSFQKQFLSQLVINILENRCNIFCRQERRQKSKNCIDIPSISENKIELIYSDRSETCHSTPFRVFLSNAYIDDEKKELCIQYLSEQGKEGTNNGSSAKDHLTTKEFGSRQDEFLTKKHDILKDKNSSGRTKSGIWLSTMQLEELLELCLSYEFGLQKKLFGFWKSAGNICRLARLKTSISLDEVFEDKCENSIHRVSEVDECCLLDHMRKTVTDTNVDIAATRRHYGDYVSQKYETVEKPRMNCTSNCCKSCVQTTTDDLDIVSNKYIGNNGNEEIINLKESMPIRIVSLADVNDISSLQVHGNGASHEVLYFTHTNPINAETSRNKRHLAPNKFNRIYASTTCKTDKAEAIDALKFPCQFETVEKSKSVEFHGIVGFSTLRSLSLEMMNLLEIACAESNMLTELSTQLIAGSKY